MKLRFGWVGVLAILFVAQWSVTAHGFSLLNRMHVGRVKTVDGAGSRLIIEGMFHNRSFRDISVTLEPDALIINPGMTDHSRRVERRDIRPGYYVALECTQSGKRHSAGKVTITSTDEEERLQRSIMRRGRVEPPAIRGMGGGLR